MMSQTAASSSPSSRPEVTGRKHIWPLSPLVASLLSLPQPQTSSSSFLRVLLHTPSSPFILLQPHYSHWSPRAPAEFFLHHRCADPVHGVHSCSVFFAQATRQLHNLLPCHSLTRLETSHHSHRSYPPGNGSLYSWLPFLPFLASLSSYSTQLLHRYIFAVSFPFFTYPRNFHTFFTYTAPSLL